MRARTVCSLPLSNSVYVRLFRMWMGFIEYDNSLLIIPKFFSSLAKLFLMESNQVLSENLAFVCISLTLFLLNRPLTHFSKHPSSLSVNHELSWFLWKQIHYDFHLDKSVELLFVHNKLFCVTLGSRLAGVRPLLLHPLVNFKDFNLPQALVNESK
jgi:hypothetical protein